MAEDQIDTGHHQSVADKRWENTQGALQDFRSSPEGGKEKPFNLAETAKSIAIDTMGKLNQKVSEIKPGTGMLATGAVLVGAFAAAEWVGYIHGVQILTPPGGSLMDGIREMASVTKFTTENLENTQVFAPGADKLQAAFLAVSPYTRVAFTALTGLFAGGAVVNQNTK